MKLITFFHPNGGVPTVVFYFAEKLIIDHHFGTMWLVMLEMNKAAVTKLLTPFWKMLRNNVCVNVNFMHPEKGIKKMEKSDDFAESLFFPATIMEGASICQMVPFLVSQGKAQTVK